MRKVLLDANLLIAVFDETPRTSEPQRGQAKRKLNTLLSDETVTLVITPLIRYEVLRGISWDDPSNFIQLKQALDGLTELDVNQGVSELAANLFRFRRSEDESRGIKRKEEKHKFDMFHLASAKQHSLELASQDSDIASLDSLYHRYNQALQ
uniref:PilT protein domain protein n=1 Tax=uncultured Thiotrichaceae bacterium TaxID=298394 RepID=A0A6S6SXA0_9GAMM|nr:MAG: PilT protein domain protein [uncultured Thiotrichaceae bacterium]